MKTEFETRTGISLRQINNKKDFTYHSTCTD